MLRLVEVEEQRIAEVVSASTAIEDVQDALDLLAEAYVQGATSMMLQEHHLPPAFFELRTGMAGEILQKFANYRMKLVVIGQFEKYQSRSLQAFINESNRGNSLLFAADRETVMARLAGRIHDATG